MNSLMLAMSMGGHGVSPEALRAIKAQRQRNYEKLSMFIKWVVTTLIYAYYWLKKHPDILQEDKKTKDESGKGTQALVNAFWDRQDQKDFIANMIRDGAELLLGWLKPDDHEMDMWTAVMSNPSPVAQLPQMIGNQQAQLQALLQQMQAAPVYQAAPYQAPVQNQPGPLPAGMTAQQYFSQYGFWPQASNANPPAGNVNRSRTGGL